MNTKTIQVMLTLDVSTYTADPLKLAKAWIADVVGEVGSMHQPWYAEDLFGDIDVLRVKVEE
jgi:hypothetical protein